MFAEVIDMHPNNLHHKIITMQLPC